MYNFSYEIMYNYLLPLSYDDILNYCRTDQWTRNICKDNYFWRMKYEYNYPDQNGIIPFNLTPMQFAKMDSRGDVKLLPVYKGNVKEIIGKFWVNKDMLDFDIEDMVYTLDNVDDVDEYNRKYKIGLMDKDGKVFKYLTETRGIVGNMMEKSLENNWNKLDSVWIRRQGLRIGEMEMSYL